MTKKAFHKKIYDFYAKENRILPWRTTKNPYKIVVSEVMLQQTQAHRVIPKYHAFLKKFPTVQALARASVADVLKEWQGLGYNRRALLLKKMALCIIEDCNGKFPKTYEGLLELPGVGPYTASAVMAFAYDSWTVMIETNIRAVFLHVFFPEGLGISDKQLLPYIGKYGDTLHPRKWYNALMDYGEMLKREHPNPSRKSAHHAIQSMFNGSVRQVRGAIIRAYTGNTSITKAILVRMLPYEKKIVVEQYEKLKNEGFFK